MTLVLSYNGLLALSLSMPKHYRQVFTHPPSGMRGHLLGLGGWLSLSASLAASIATNGWSFGPVEWIGMLAVTGLALVFLLPHAPRIATVLGIVALVTAPMLILRCSS